MSEAVAAPPSLLRTPAAKVGMILGLLLLMQIPLFMVSSLIDERQARQENVLAGFRRGWGPEQVLAGPMLVVPYSWTTPAPKTGGQATVNQGWARIPASRLGITATLQPETRRRGLFHAVVYTAAVDLAGTFVIPPLDLSATPGALVDWPGARLVIAAADLRGVAADARADWNGATVPLEPADSPASCPAALLQAPAGLPDAPASGAAIPFHAAIALRGTEAFHIVPLGRQVELRLTSAWTTPSFVGATLPARYDLGAAGFDAHWQLSGAARWLLAGTDRGACAGAADPAWSDDEAQIGVQLQEPVPTYLMVSRASKYGVLFLALSYLTLFLFETLSRVRIHLVQYGLLGLSVSLFALVLIAIAEPLGFTLGYALATVAVLAQASLYTLSVTRRPRLAATFAAILAGLFAFLYVVLRLDSYSLLGGTAALFLILSVVMAATRRVNWSAASA